MIEIARFATLDAARYARSLLTAAGIPTVLVSDEPPTFPSDPPPGARLNVADTDAETAAAILGLGEPGNGRRP
jgi:hypothetical protein